MSGGLNQASILAVAVTTRFIATVVTYAADPLSPLWIISAVFIAITAYDSIKMGDNIRRHAERQEIGSQGVVGALIHMSLLQKTLTL